MTLSDIAPPLIASDLVPEIRDTLAESRRWRAAEPPELRSPSAQRAKHEESVMLDVTLALLIRHRLPIDADATQRAVHDARPQNLDDIDGWALGCAKYIASISQRLHDEGTRS